MNTLLLLNILIAGGTIHVTSITPTSFPLWNGSAPGALGNASEDIPTLTLYTPDEKHRNGASVVVCPGGGYGGLADHEGKPIAEWLNTLGITAFVLKYRLGPRYHHPIMWQDASRAIRTLRARAGEWHLDPDRIGIIGFSAGGHLCSTMATHFDSGSPSSPDIIERASSRPNFAMPIYPVITMAEPYTHLGSRHNLLGDNPSPDLIELMSNEKQVTPQTPPIFLMHTADDEAVPAENSLLFALACRKAGVPVELHIYAHGRHGVGLAKDLPDVSSWPSLAADWMRGRGMLKSK